MRWKIVAGGLWLALGVVVAWQGWAIRDLRRQLAAPATNTVVSQPSAAPLSQMLARRVAAPAEAKTVASGSDEGLSARVALLEDAVAQWNKASEFLMDRGQIPLTPVRIAELQQRFLDRNADARDRLRALALLQRNDGLNDAVVQAAISWIGSATNGWLRDGLMRELSNSTNSLLREPMMKLASTDPESRVREMAVRSLRRFVADSQVESLLWGLMRTEKDPRVQQQVAEALRNAPVTPSRVAELRARAVAEDSPLEARLVAVTALHRAGESADEATTALVQLVQTMSSADERARVFSAFDGIHAPQMVVPLVNGLQDPSPTVRARAADALSGYTTDPAVAEWLRYVAQNDADARVRHEAEEALRERRATERSGGDRREGGPGRERR